MRISYLADHPEFIPALAPAIWAHWRDELPEDATIGHRIIKLQQHAQKKELPIALIAHRQGEVLGTAALRQCDLEGREDLSPWLGGVFVMPDHRGKGVASELCRAIQQLAHSTGVETIYLFTHDQQNLYEQLGWCIMDEAAWGSKWGSIMRLNMVD